MNKSGCKAKRLNLSAAVPEPAAGEQLSGIPDSFWGLSFEKAALLPDENGRRYFRPDNQPLSNLFHTLGIKSLRIGGKTSDRDAVRLPADADIDSLFAFARLANVKAIYCLRLCHGSPTEAAMPAKYISERYGDFPVGSILWNAGLAN
jgi:hypothetical protein